MMVYVIPIYTGPKPYFMRLCRLPCHSVTSVTLGQLEHSGHLDRTSLLTVVVVGKAYSTSYTNDATCLLKLLTSH